MNKIPAGYKKTEVGIIPEDWKTICIGDLVKSLEAGISVNSVEKDSVSFAHGLSVLKTSCVIGGKFIPEEHKAIIPRDIFRAKLNPRQNSIIISRMNTPALVGECGYVERDCPRLFLPDRLWMTRHDNRFPHDVRWLAYLLSFSAFNRAIKESATGTSGSMKNISKASLFAVLIPFPRHSEQTAIATALNDADALITQLEKLIAKKRLIKQGAMQQLLTGKKRLAGFDRHPDGRPKGHKQTALGPIPEDWEVKELKDLIKIKGGFAFSSQNFSNTGPILLTPGNFQLDGGLYFEERNTKRFSGFYNSSMQLKFGDLVIVMTDLTPDCNLLGKPAFVSMHEPVLHNQRIGKIELLFEKLSYQYFYWVFLSNTYLKRIKETATGSTVRHTSNSSVLGTNIPLPTAKAEQTAIAKTLSDMDIELDALETRLAKHKQIKQGMMQTLLTGKIRLL